MAAAHVQFLGSNGNDTTQTTTVISPSGKTVTSGNGIVVGGMYWANGGTVSAVDNLGNTYTFREQATVSSARTTCVLTAPVTSAGSLTSITITHPSALYTQMSAAEFSGVGTYYAAGGGASFSSQTTPPWTASATIPASGIAVGFAATGDTRTWTAGAATGSPSTTIYLSNSTNTVLSVGLVYAIAGGSEVTGFSGTAENGLSCSGATAGVVFNPSSGTSANAGLAAGTGAAQVPSGGGSASAAFVQALGRTENGTPTQTSTVLSCSKTVTAGYTIVVGWGSCLGGYSTAVTDNLGNSYSKVESTTRSLANASLWSAPVTTGGSLTTITVTHGSSQYVYLWAAEVSGVTGSPTAAGGTTASSVGPVQWMASGTIPANGLAIGFETHSDTRTPSAGAASGSPSTTIYLSDTGSTYSSMAYAVAGGSEVTAFTGTTGIQLVSTSWAGAGAIFSPTAAPGMSTGTGTGTGTAYNAQVSTGGGGSGTLQERIDAATAGSTIDVAGLTFDEDDVIIAKALTIRNGTLYYGTGSHGLHITASNVTIDGMTIIGPSGSVAYVRSGGVAEHCIYVEGSKTAHLSGITVQNCSLYYARSAGVWYEYTDGTVIYHNTIADTDYAGVMAIGTNGGSISWNYIPRCGMRGEQTVNAYNIVVDTYGDVAADVSYNITVSDNIVEDNPFWHGLDTHSGQNIHFLRNIVRRCRKGLFLTSTIMRPTVIVTDNWLETPLPYTWDTTPCTLSDVASGTFTNNRYFGWPSASATDAKPWYDYGGASTNLVNGGGNRVINQPANGVATSVHPFGSTYLIGPTNGTGTAYNATISTTNTPKSVYPERATGSGTAYQPGVTTVTPSVQVSPWTATGTGLANNASVTMVHAAVSAPAATATGVGYAHNPPFGGVGKPTISVRVDFGNDGFASGSPDDISASVLSDSLSWTRGRSADFSAEATGEARFTVRNDDDRYATTTFLPGMAVHISAVLSAVVYPLFYGFIERVAPDPVSKTITITCYDVLRRMGETDAVAYADPYVARTTRDFRIAILSDYERGNRNLVPNPSFESNTDGWSVYGSGTLARLTSDGEKGTCCAEFTWTSGTPQLQALVLLAPGYFANVVYTLSVYMKATSGSQAVTFSLFHTSADKTEKTVTVDGTWRRYTLTHRLTSSGTAAASALYPIFYLTSGSVRIDGVQVTRGQAELVYADTGTGRWPNWCGNGGLETGVTGWKRGGWKQLCANGDFETNTAGWSTGTDSFITVAAGTLARDTTTYRSGVACAKLTNANGMYYALTGTFLAGVTYRVSMYVGGAPVILSYAACGIGSNGTPTDYAESPVTTIPVSGPVTRVACSWTPTADRSDVHVYLKSSSVYTIYVDDVLVMRSDPTQTDYIAAYTSTGPGGGGSYAEYATGATAKYGALSRAWTTPAVAGAGTIYDFYHVGAAFAKGVPYTLSLWLNPSTSMPYKVGFGANAGYTANGVWDESSSSGLAPAGVWTQVVVTWTPSDDQLASHEMGDAVIFVYQTDATARTFSLDGVRVIPGSSADDFEMGQWALSATETDIYSYEAEMTGTVASTLATLNDLSLSRHWIEPTAASPWYRYVTRSRDDLATKTSAETYDDDLNDMTAAEIDRASIINVVPVTWESGTAYYSDPTSVATYGTRPTGAIDGAGFFGATTYPDIIGPALVARYKDPRARPKITVVNRFPSQLARELDDLVTITFARLGIVAGTYLIAGLTTTIGDKGHTWTTEYQLEAF